MSDNIEADALLNYPELLESYLTTIRERRDANRRNRKRERVYWNAAIKRLGAERDASVEEGDVEIAEEIERVIAAFRRALVFPSLPGHLPAPEAKLQVKSQPVVAVAEGGAPPTAPDEAIPPGQSNEQTEPKASKANIKDQSNDIRVIPNEQIRNVLARGLRKARYVP